MSQTMITHRTAKLQSCLDLGGPLARHGILKAPELLTVIDTSCQAVGRERNRGILSAMRVDERCGGVPERSTKSEKKPLIR